MRKCCNSGCAEAATNLVAVPSTVMPDRGSLNTYCAAHAREAMLEMGGSDLTEGTDREILHQLLSADTAEPAEKPAHIRSTADLGSFGGLIRRTQYDNEQAHRRTREQNACLLGIMAALNVGRERVAIGALRPEGGDLTLALLERDIEFVIDRAGIPTRKDDQ